MTFRRALAFLFGEAFRNVKSARARTIMMLVLVLAGLFATEAEAHMSAQSALTSAKELEIRGYTIVVLSGGTISGAECARLGAIEGVEAAGAVRRLGDGLLRPGTVAPYSAYGATPEFVRVLAPDSQLGAARVVIGQELADEVGAKSVEARGVVILSESGQVSSTQVLPVAPLVLKPNNSYFGRAIITLQKLDAPYSECYVRLSSPVSKNAPQLLAGASGFRAETIQGQWLIDHSLLGEDPVLTYSHRPAKWLWLVLSLVIGLGIFAQQRARGVEIALYRSQGASVLAVTAILGCEVAILFAVAMASWAVPLAVIGADTADALVGAAVLVAGDAAILFLGASLLWACLSGFFAALGQPWELLRRQ